MGSRRGRTSCSIHHRYEVQHKQTHEDRLNFETTTAHDVIDGASMCRLSAIRNIYETGSRWSALSRFLQYYLGVGG
jgi:hypothetical protein